MENLKENIFKLIKKREYVTFAQLLNKFDIIGGNCSITARPNSNIYYWVGLNENGASAIMELINEKKIFAHPADELSYIDDGAALDMDIIKSNRNYKTPHWAPIAFCTYPMNQIEPQLNKPKPTSKPKAKKGPTLPRMSFRKDNQVYEIHYLSPNKARRMTSITVSLLDFEKDKAELIAKFLLHIASKLEDDPTATKGTKSGTRITQNCKNDDIMRNAKEAVIKFLSNF